jgi:hypothetical protein
MCRCYFNAATRDDSYSKSASRLLHEKVSLKGSLQIICTRPPFHVNAVKLGLSVVLSPTQKENNGNAPH